MATPHSIRIRLSLLASLLMVMGTGCSEASDPTTDPSSTLTVTDSAGIPVASFLRDRLPVLAEVSEHPEWIIGEGGDSGLDPALHGVASVVQVAEGRIAIAEGSTQEVLFADLEEGRIDRAGGAGDGPEEFRGLSALYRTGNEGVWAADRRRHRMVELQWGGEVVGASSLPDLLAGGLMGHLLLDGTGSVYIAQLGAMHAPDPARTRRPMGALVRMGERADTVTMLQGQELFSNEEAAGSVFWGVSTQVAPAPDGIWVGDTGMSQVELWREPGQPSTIIRWSDDSDRRVTEADEDRFFAQLEELAGPEERVQLEVMRPMIVFAEERPFFGPMVVGRDGSLWIGPPRDPAFDVFEGAGGGLAPPAEWLVVHVEDEKAGRVVTPAGFRLLEAGEGYVLGVHRDAVGRESVRLHRFMGSEDCRPLPEAVRLTLESRQLPEGWTLGDAVIVLADDITRASDGAPSEVIVAHVLDDAGQRFSEGPVEWVIEAGPAAAPEFTGPQSILLLNPASHALLERVAEERPVRAPPDATAEAVGWSLDHPVVTRARECLGVGS